MSDTETPPPLPEPFAWRYGASFWERLESIPAAIRPCAVPLYSQEDMDRLRAENAALQGQLSEERHAIGVMREAVQSLRQSQERLDALRDEPERVGIVQAVSVDGQPLRDSRGIEWLKAVAPGTVLYAARAAGETRNA